MKTLTISLAVFAASLALVAQKPVWSTDFDAAKAQAAKENKPLLVDFTGANWCPYCVLLDREVFANPAFAEIARKYVLVKVDFPPRKERTEAKIKADPTLAKAMELKERFKIEGFPTVLVLSPAGLEQARRSGYEKGTGPVAYFAALEKAR